MRIEGLAHACPARGVIDIEQEEYFLVGIVTKLFEFAEQLTVAQDVDGQRALGCDQRKAVEIASQLFQFAHQMRGKRHGTEARHVRQATDLELPVAKESLPQTARLLQADQQHIRPGCADPPEQALAQDGQGIDADHRHLVRQQDVEPRRQQFGPRDRGQQQDVVAALVRLAPLKERCVIGRAAKQSRVFAFENGAAVRTAHVGNGFLAILFLDHVDEYA